MVVAPAGPVDPARLAQVPALILAQGWVPCIAPGCAMQRGDLAGDDTRRLADLQAALDDPDVAAVWCLRGGYGSARLRPTLNLAGMLGDVAGVLLGSFTEAEDCGAALRDHLLALGVPLPAGWQAGRRAMARRTGHCRWACACRCRRAPTARVS